MDVEAELDTEPDAVDGVYVTPPEDRETVAGVVAESILVGLVHATPPPVFEPVEVGEAAEPEETSVATA